MEVGPSRHIGFRDKNGQIRGGGRAREALIVWPGRAERPWGRSNPRPTALLAHLLAGQRAANVFVKLFVRSPAVGPGYAQVHKHLGFGKADAAGAVEYGNGIDFRAVGRAQISHYTLDVLAGFRPSPALYDQLITRHPISIGVARVSAAIPPAPSIPAYRLRSCGPLYPV